MQAEMPPLKDFIVWLYEGQRLRKQEVKARTWKQRIASAYVLWLLHNPKTKSEFVQQLSVLGRYPLQGFVRPVARRLWEYAKPINAEVK